jgi:micrococcal nuclease
VIALVVWGLFASGLWPLLTLVFVFAAAIVILPWIGPRALGLARWRAVPVLGTLTGIAAAASIFAMGIGVTVLGATLAPLPSRSPTSASATTPAPNMPTPRATAPARGATVVAADIAPQTSQSRVRAQVLSVTDGDTIRVSIDGHSVAIRYIGIDTPETVDPRTSVECFGREATAFNRELVEGKTVELEKDVSELDKFGRTLRYVWIERGSQMVMANEELVRSGYARASTYPPDVKYQERLGGLEAVARTNGLGLWGAVCAAASPTSAPVAVTLAPTAVPPPVLLAAPTAAPRTVAPATRAPTAAPRTAAPSTRINCHASYPTVCIPPAPPDLDCGDIPYRRFTVLPPDPHRFDGDKDGIGCE